MYLPKLKQGSEITIETDYGIFQYQVYDTKIIKDTDEESLPIQNNKEILMMYTCYPISSIGFKNKRYVVYAQLTDSEYTGDEHE